MGFHLTAIVFKYGVLLIKLPIFSLRSPLLGRIDGCRNKSKWNQTVSSQRSLIFDQKDESHRQSLSPPSKLLSLLSPLVK